MSSPAINILQIRAVQGRSEELGQQLTTLLAALREAPGCLAYSAQCNTADSQHWTVRGQWRSAAEMQAHFHLPAAQGFIDLLDRRLACALDFEH
ncbi:antibiotic biosynthesis monooxygenase family protein [Pseudomonas chlororaphis]|uniref:antibiotic biosynthesis monooxygenase family protein n=1 Tax=Pseudomonas chlororaphis TaxID=587753 RepID=UPI002367E3B6|nr:antibiotic biosynthesis monooxygenase [Pseudomonas chlororaphis]WDH38050.1 antibiotic biosynthesis monooxygenase [Pseudomonas chlororaphis]WDH44137.1 antibiotic biosynthesis monooxygenase [Pseudomonas chlororaphis]